MATKYTTTCGVSLTSIDGTDCIGDSRTIINNNISTIGSTICTLSSRENALAAYDDTLTTYDAYLLSLINTLSSNQTDIKITNYFRSTESYPVTATSLTVASIYVNQTGNPTANGTAITDNPTNIWRRFNTTEYSYGDFAQIKKVGGNDNGTYIELSAGYYDIRAGAVMHSIDTHCAALIKFTPGLADYTTIATGTIGSTDVDGATFDSITSYVQGRFYFPVITGIALMNIYTGKYGSLNPTVGGKPFATVPTWMRTYLPTIDTAWIEILKISPTSY